MKARNVAWVVVPAVALAIVGCASSSGSTSPAQQIAPGSAVVPCSQIATQIKTINQLFSEWSPGDSRLYSAETALANRFGNVSNLDTPQSVSGAEVDFETDILDNAWDVEDSNASQTYPAAPAIQEALQNLASACGVVLPNPP
jgi:hypothetical protein